MNCCTYTNEALEQIILQIHNLFRLTDMILKGAEIENYHFPPQNFITQNELHKFFR